MITKIYYRGYVIHRRVDRVQGHHGVGSYWALTPGLTRLEAPTLRELKALIREVQI